MSGGPGSGELPIGVLPSACFTAWRILVSSLYVYDRNRPLAPIVLRQRRCSLMYDVYWTCIDGDGSCITGSKYLEYNLGLKLNIYLMNNEQ
jgi:hypothetical protein